MEPREVAESADAQAKEYWFNTAPEREEHLSWDEMIERLRARPADDRGKRHVPATYEDADGVKLGIWVQNQHQVQAVTVRAITVRNGASTERRLHRHIVCGRPSIKLRHESLES